MLSNSLSVHIFANAHTYIYSFSHITHFTHTCQHAARAPDGRLRLSSHRRRPVHTSRPAADHLHLRYGLCARQHNQSQPSLRTHALSGTPDGAFCRRVRHPPPAHSSPAPCTCPPKPPAPVSPPNDRTPGRAPAPGSLSHSLRGTKPLARRLSAAVPAAAHRTPHPNTSMRHRSRPPLRPSAYAPAHPTSDAKRGGLGGAQSTSCARQVAATCTERFGLDAVMAKKRHNLRTRGSRFQRQKSPPLLYTTCSPPPWGSLTPAPAGGADAGRLWHGGTRTEGAHSGGDLRRQLQPLPPHPDRPMQRAPHLLRQAPGTPGPTRAPMQGTQPPIPLSWAATRAGGGQDR